VSGARQTCYSTAYDCDSDRSIIVVVVAAIVVIIGVAVVRVCSNCVGSFSVVVVVVLLALTVCFAVAAVVNIGIRFVHTSSEGRCC